MKILKFLPLLLLTLACQPRESYLVQTDKGLIEGYEKGDLNVFKGIPFAAPPVGLLRWKAPVEHDHWVDKLECKAFSASPMQSEPKPFAMWTEEFIAPPEPLSEDCLYLNIWAKKSKGKKPVFVWIYGGGFNSGSAACDIYDGEKYAKNDVVFVSINYRVNVFGYLAHPDLSAENEDKVSGNYGLLDQIAALKWVQRNIELFGGDPDNITIAGQSAGSMSVHALLASPKAKGLFHKAIGQSGGLLGSDRVKSLEEAEQKGQELTSKLEGKSIADLRKIPAQELFHLVREAGGSLNALLSDGVVLPNDIKGHFEAGKHNDVPFLGGWVAADGKLFSAPDISPKDYFNKVKEEFGDDTNDYLNLFPGETKDQLQNSMSKRNLINFAVTPVSLLAKYNKNDVYVYEFTHEPPLKENFPDYGAFHTSDVPFTLHNLHTWKRNWRAEDLKVERAISTYWINFIKTGNPNGEGLANWPIYHQGGTQVIDTEISTSKGGLYEKELGLILSK